MSNVALSPTKRSGALDLLRFFASLLIFYFHFSDAFNSVYRIVPENLKYGSFIRYGICAMTIFFIISGFVITMTSMTRTVKDYMIVRFSRLYPLFWFSCAVTFLISRYLSIHSYLPPYVPLKTFLINLSMVPTLFGVEQLNPVYHTMVIELGFYTFILLIIIFKLWKHILSILAALVAICYIAIFYDSGLNVLLSPFIAGMLFYFMYAKMYTQWKVMTLAALNFILGLLSAKNIAHDMNINFDGPNLCNPWILALLIACIYGLILLIALRKVNFSGNPVTRKLGEISYSFYLFHLNFLGIYWYYRNSLQPDLLLIAMAVLITVCCWGINVFIEKPSSKISVQVLALISSSFKKTIPHKPLTVQS
jgi:peptidoglycan/LPS O-acetylase OafA/YrhL